MVASCTNKHTISRQLLSITCSLTICSCYRSDVYGVRTERFRVSLGMTDNRPDRIPGALYCGRQLCSGSVIFVENRRAPKFLDQHYKIEHTSHLVWIFRGDRPTELRDLVVKRRKEKKQQQNIRRRELPFRAANKPITCFCCLLKGSLWFR